VLYDKISGFLSNLRPSRCPGNAVWDGTDAVMLSGEAASGKFPCEAVMAEAAAAREAESAAWSRGWLLENP